MNSFERAALRLKQELGLKTDKDVAEALGLSSVAWVGRKKRDNFPETELFALKTKRPEFDLDIAYVLTGVRESGPNRQMTERMAAAVAAVKSPEVAASAARTLETITQLRAARQRYVDLFAYRAQWCSDAQLDKVLELMTELKGPGPASLGELESPAKPAHAAKVQQTFHADVGQAISGGDHMQNTYVARKLKKAK